jgi:hypothetical protein
VILQHFEHRRFALAAVALKGRIPRCRAREQICPARPPFAAKSNSAQVRVQQEKLIQALTAPVSNRNPGREENNMWKFGAYFKSGLIVVRQVTICGKERRNRAHLGKRS